MDTLNALLTRLSELFLAPFRSFPTTGLVLWSVVIGILMTYIFGKTSNQAALRRAADNIRAQLFGLKLFKEDLLITLQCQVALFKSTGVRLLHSFPPMLVMLAPLLLVLTQLAMRYEHRPLAKGERTVVSLRVKPDRWKEIRDISITQGEGFEVETPALRDEKNSTIYWRLRATGAAEQLLQWQVGDRTISKRLPISSAPAQLEISNPKRAGDSFWDSVLYPAEPRLPTDSPIQAIDLELPRRATPILGWNIPWWGTFFLVSVLVAFVAGKLIGVQY